MSDAYRLARRAKQDRQFAAAQAAWDNAEPGNDTDWDLVSENAGLIIRADPELLAEAARETATEAQLARLFRSLMGPQRYEVRSAIDAIADSYVASFRQQCEVAP